MDLKVEKQLYFDIDDAPSFVEDNFIISSSNQNATDYVYKWPNWASNCVVLFGESGVGKSHLANIWHNKAQALKVSLENIDFKDVQKRKNILIDDFELYSNKYNDLFHIINLINEINGYLLMTSKVNPASLSTGMKDLDSRLRNATPIKIDRPDDFLLEAIIIKLFSDKRILIDDRVIKYILKRSNRSASELIKLVNIINNKSMEQKRAITVPLVRDVFSDVGY